MLHYRLHQDNRKTSKHKATGMDTLSLGTPMTLRHWHSTWRIITRHSRKEPSRVFLPTWWQASEN